MVEADGFFLRLRCKVADFSSLNEYAVALVAARKIGLLFGVLLRGADEFDEERPGEMKLRIRQHAASRYNLSVMLVIQDNLR